MTRPVRLALVLVTLFCPLEAGRLGAQKTEKEERHTVMEADDLVRAASYFQQAEFAELRAGMGVDQVPMSATVEIIDDADLRKSLASAALASLGRVYHLTSTKEAKESFASYDVHCFRIGKYYTTRLVISEAAQRKHPVIVNGWHPLLVFKAVKSTKGDREGGITFEYVGNTSM